MYSLLSPYMNSSISGIRQSLWFSTPIFTRCFAAIGWGRGPG